MNEVPPNASPTAKFDDPLTTVNATTSIDNYRASQVLLAAIPGMSRDQLLSAIEPLTIEHMAAGPQQIVFTAVRATQHQFPVSADRTHALALIHRHLVEHGLNTPEVSELIVDMATAPDSGIPVEHLVHAVQMEQLARQCWQAVEELLNPRAERVAA